jgi:hypothetical protein
MLLTAVATIRTRRWNGWQRFAPLLCGIVPFAVELPRFVTFGDSSALYYFIACTWTAWLILFTALWSQSSRPTADLTTPPTTATMASQAWLGQTEGWRLRSRAGAGTHGWDA